MQEQVLNFWFEEAGSEKWFEKSTEFDRILAERFTDVLEQAAAAEFYSWRTSARDRLAEIIVLDQFSRNIYRNKLAGFAQDAMALALAQEAVAAGTLQEINDVEARNFILMPYMHSESQLIYHQAEQLFKQHSNEKTYGFELRHTVIIDQFARYPHRNEILGRTSTTEEIEFLTQTGSSFL